MDHPRGLRRPIRAVLGGVLLAVGLAQAPAGSATTLYKWVDDDGVVHYSDQPHAGAEKIQVAKPQTYAATRVPKPAPSSTTTQPAPAQGYYRRVQITSPSDGDVFVNTGGRVPVAVDLEPAIAPGHQLWFSLDGQRVESLGVNATEGTLEDVDRGDHTVAVSITDASGNVVANASVSFTVRQPSAIKPNHAQQHQ